MSDGTGTIGRLRTFVLVALPIVLILAPLGLSLYDHVFARDALEDGDAAPFLEFPAERDEGCVRDSAYMRFHHWELLREVRDQAMRHGVRGEISLDRCRTCHASRERLCNRCHEAVSLEPDCFGCHYYPASPTALTSDTAPAHGPGR